MDYGDQRLTKEINIKVDIREGPEPIKLINSTSDKFNICSFIIPNFSFIKRKVKNRQIDKKTFSWWEFECKDEWIPDSMTKFGCKVKTRSMQEELSTWVSYWISQLYSL